MSHNTQGEHKASQKASQSSPQPEGELEQLIETRIKTASTQTKSDDEVVHIAWLADGIDLWHRSGHKMGHSPAKAHRYIISSITRLVAAKQTEAVIKELRNWAAFFTDPSMNAMTPSERLYKRLAELQSNIPKGGEP